MQKGQPARRIAVPGLAALLMSGNSGGIVGLITGLIGRLGLRPGRGCAPFGLRLAALEIGPQCRPQAALLAGLLGALRTLVHGGKIKGRRHAMEALSRGLAARSVLAPLWPLWQGSPLRGRIPRDIAAGPALP
jgi:hypothetical protein